MCLIFLTNAHADIYQYLSDYSYTTADDSTILTVYGNTKDFSDSLFNYIAGRHIFYQYGDDFNYVSFKQTFNLQRRYSELEEYTPIYCVGYNSFIREIERDLGRRGIENDNIAYYKMYIIGLSNEEHFYRTNKNIIHYERNPHIYDIKKVLISISNNINENNVDSNVVINNNVVDDDRIYATLIIIGIIDKKN